jgi:hypothetical protein
MEAQQMNNVAKTREDEHQSHNFLQDGKKN